mmetsp:Transcript_38167/g.61262  ORF Transcript_38167/g.61262 Transcript_38167/m.61262 type:complete len:153 (-) Transcript_38167:311-769(-)
MQNMNQDSDLETIMKNQMEGAREAKLPAKKVPRRTSRSPKIRRRSPRRQTRKEIIQLSRSPIRGRYRYTKKEKQYLSRILQTNENASSPRFSIKDSIASAIFVEDPIKIDEGKVFSESGKHEKMPEVKMPEINPGDLLPSGCSSSASGNMSK